MMKEISTEKKVAKVAQISTLDKIHQNIQDVKPCVGSNTKYRNLRHRLSETGELKINDFPIQTSVIKVNSHYHTRCI